MSQWYYSKNNQRQGPVSSEQLKQLAATGQLQPSDLVWKEGMAQWAAASSIKGLFAAPAAPPPPNFPPVIQNCPPTQATTGWNPPFKLSLGFYSWPAVAALLLCCFPFGLYLVWTHPSWTRNVKVVWSAAWLVLVLMVSASRNTNEHSRRTSSSPTADNKQKAATVVSVDAWTLVADYKDNEVAADEKYKGKTLKVNGFIGDIKKDITDTMYVILTIWWRV